jgi:hypothetical protein
VGHDIACARQSLFVPQVEQLAADIEAHTFRFSRSNWLQEHLINAKEAPGKFGVSMRKEHRESKKKIDLAVCAAGGRMLWRLCAAGADRRQEAQDGQGPIQSRAR